MSKLTGLTDDQKVFLWSKFCELAMDSKDNADKDKAVEIFFNSKEVVADYYDLRSDDDKKSLQALANSILKGKLNPNHKYFIVDEKGCMQGIYSLNDTNSPYDESVLIKALSHPDLYCDLYDDDIINLWNIYAKQHNLPIVDYFNADFCANHFNASNNSLMTNIGNLYTYLMQNTQKGATLYVCKNSDNDLVVFSAISDNNSPIHIKLLIEWFSS